MILADKIINLRKKAGWSQEELAEQLGVSRQSISKWEGAQSIPDKDKILQLSKTFNVSTDYLLKDEIEDMPEPKEEQMKDSLNEEFIPISIEDANKYIDLKKKSAPKIALGVFFCIISLIPMLLLNKASDLGILNISDSQIQSFGIAILLVFVCAAVFLFIKCAYGLKEFEDYDKKYIKTAYGVDGMVASKRDNYKEKHISKIAIGIILCILSAVPMIIGKPIESRQEICTSICLLMIAIGVFLIVKTSIIWSSYNFLLEKGRYTRQRKQLAYVRKIYWAIVLSIFLILGFVTNRWSDNWIIWPIAAVLFCALQAILLSKKK